MNVYVTGFTANKKILAIKGIRAATGLGLKESKQAADEVEAGQRVKLTLQTLDSEKHLEESGVVFQRVPVTVTLEELVDILGYYPPEMPVGDVVRILRAARAHTEPEASA